MSDRDTEKDAGKSDPEKKTGKFHYNPVNMSGKEAGKFKDQDEGKDGQSGEEDRQPEDDGGDRLGRK